MTRINTNVASLRGLRNLDRANNLLNTSLTRLSTGLKINSGKDNPAGLIASETLRSQITVIEQSIKNSNRANNVISTADAALGEITGLLNQVRGLIQEGLNNGALSTAEIEANQSQIDEALSAINRISANTKFGSDKLIDGSKAFTTQLTSADNAKLSDFQINSAVFAGSSSVVIDATITGVATRGELFNDFVSGGLTSATTLEVSGAKGTDVIFLGAGSTLDNIKAAFDGVKDATGVEAVKTAPVAGKGTIASSGANDDLIFTDKRAATGDQAEFTQVLKVKINQKTSGSTLAVTSSSTASEILLTVTLGTDASNNVTSTASDVKALLESDANSSAYVTVSLEGTGAGTIDAADLGDAQVTVNTGAKDAFLTFRSTDFGSAQFVGVKVLQGTFTTTKDSVGGAAAERVSGTDVQARINGQIAQGKGLKTTIRTAGLNASLTFTSAANTANNNAKITVTGGGSLFQIGQDVSTSGQVSLGIDAVNTGRLGGVSGKLFELGSGGGKSLLDVSPTLPGSDLVNIVDEAISRVTELRGRLGSLQKNVVDTNIATLGVALESISEARSQIVDTDFAAETANLTRAQILSQSGLSVLAIANQNPSQVLSLLG